MSSYEKFFDLVPGFDSFLQNQKKEVENKDSDSDYEEKILNEFNKLKTKYNNLKINFSKIERVNTELTDIINNKILEVTTNDNKILIFKNIEEYSHKKAFKAFISKLKPEIQSKIIFIGKDIISFESFSTEQLEQIGFRKVNRKVKSLKGI